MKTVYLFIGLLISNISLGQTIETRIATAFKKLETDSQLKHALMSLYIVNSKTGKVMFDKWRSVHFIT